MKILLTGATGLLGSHILHQGLKKGYKFKLLVRDIPKRSYLTEVLNLPEIECIKVDFQQILDRPEDFHHLFLDIDTFINSMGYASPLHKDSDLMNQVNFLIPQCLFSLASKFKINSLVNVSSVATMSSGESDQLINELCLGTSRPSPYANSKLKLDRWIDDEFKQSTLSIHPCYMLGKWDSKPSSGSILFGLKLKKFKYFVNTQKNFVAASDVAKALWSGIEKKATGHFLIGGVNLSIEKFIKEVSVKLKIQTDDISFIKKEDWRKQSASLEAITIQQVEEFCFSNAVDDTKAREKLDHKPNENIEEIIDEVLQYFIQKKLLRA